MTSTGPENDAQRLADETRRRARRMGWIAFGFAVLSLAMVGVAGFFGPVPWTSWVLPLMLTINGAVMLFPFRSKRAMTVYWGFSSVASLVILSEFIVRLARR